MARFHEPKVTFLPPQSFPSLILDVSSVDVGYELKLPLSLYRGLNKLFLLGKTQATLFVDLTAATSEDLPILSNVNITFDGDFDFNATLSYSSIQGISSSGQFNSKLSVEVFDKFVGIRAQDVNIFDVVLHKYTSNCRSCA